MTAVNAIAFMVSLLVLWSFYSDQAVCARCHGRGRHRRDCPMARHDDDDASHD
jgi:hypothetical protein